MTRPHPLLAAAMLVAAALVPAPGRASELPALRGDVTALRDTLTLGDLVANVPPEAAETPMFRAPGLGQTGTIQARRIAAAAEALGLGRIETGGRMQVSIHRAARHVGAPDAEAAIRKRLASDFGADPLSTGIVFDAPSPALVLEPTVEGEVVASDVTLDRRSRRVAATIWIGPSPNERRAQLRVSGIVVDLVEVAVVSRSLDRGQVVKPGDIVVERRAKDLIPTDAAGDGGPMEGRVAKRALGAGTLVRATDLIRPEIVARGDIVSVVYDAPGITLSMRAKAIEGGALGDTVNVINPSSKKSLQTVVIGPGRVSVGGSASASPARIAAAVTPAAAGMPAAAGIP